MWPLGARAKGHRSLALKRGAETERVRGKREREGKDFSLQPLVQINNNKGPHTQQ